METKQQLSLFHQSLCRFGKKEFPQPKNWFEAFDSLKLLIHQSRRKKKVVFIDEMPWLHTQKSNFLAALEYFWNHWASERNDLIFIICGSSSTWIINLRSIIKIGFRPLRNNELLITLLKMYRDTSRKGYEVNRCLSAE